MLELFLAEFKRSWIQFIRYPFEAVGGVVMLSAVFYGMFLSASYIAGSSLQFGDRLDTTIVGYVLWTLVLFTTGDIALGLQTEAQTGTLEQLFLSPFSSIQVFLVRGVAGLTLRLALNFCILLLIMAVTGRWLSFPLSLLLPLFSVLLGAYGLGFALGSLALLFKRIQQFLSIVQVSLLFLLTVPLETWTGPLQVLGGLLPMTSGAGLLRNLMARGQAFDLKQFAFALLNGIIYFGLGLLLFRWAERSAKKQGKLSGY